MQSYPSIESFNERRHSHLLGQPCYIFDKYDGSNLRFELNHSRQLVKCGARTRLMDKSDAQFGSAVTFFEHELLISVGNQLYAQLDAKVLRNAKRMVVFAEWYGDRSFAGSHHPEDEMQLRVFDVHVGNYGFIRPNEFIKVFGTEHPRAKRLLYTGYLVPELISEVRTQTGMFEKGLTEGVVIHALTARGYEAVKVKTNTWLERVKDKYGIDWERYA